MDGSIYLRTLEYLDHCSQSSAKKYGLFCIFETFRNIFIFKNVHFQGGFMVRRSRNGWPGGTTCAKSLNKCFLSEIMKFGWNCEIWLKLWNLVKIGIFGRYCDIFADIVIFGWYCDIWLILWLYPIPISPDNVTVPDPYLTCTALWAKLLRKWEIGKFTSRPLIL